MRKKGMRKEECVIMEEEGMRKEKGRRDEEE